MEAAMYRHILVPLDSSELAESVLPHATELALKLGAEVSLLTVVDSFEKVMARTLPIGGAAPASPAVAEMSVETARQLTDNQAKSAQGYLEGVAERLKTQGVTVSTT